MKMFYCRGCYIPTGCRKPRGVKGYVLAETEEEAREKFKKKTDTMTFPKPLFITASECDGDVSIYTAF